MALAYTPERKRKEFYIIRKTRRLPLPGEVLVKKGDKVSYDTEVARIKIPGKLVVVNASTILGVKPDNLEKYMFKKLGDPVYVGEVIARRRAYFGLINEICISPTKGVIEHLYDLPSWAERGQIVIREPPTSRSLHSYIPGTVIEVLPKEGVVIETGGAFIQGIFGIGGETHGEISMTVDSPNSVLTADIVGSDCKGKALVGGSMVERKALDKAVEVGARGIIVGGMKSKDISDFLGYKVGVAITGREEKGLTLILTEGFGKMKMADKTFELLKKFKGKLACINGATQIRAGVIRPEIIVPREAEGMEIEEGRPMMEGLRPGFPIRIIAPPYFGALGRVTKMPIELQRIETETNVRVLEAELEDGRRVKVPRANVELIE